MGVFSWMKNIFSSKTKWKNNKDELIKCFSQGKYVSINTKIAVDIKQNAVVVARNKVCDVFQTGEFNLSPATMPICNKRCKLDKPKKNSKSKTLEFAKRFEGYLLFINMDSISINGKSTRLTTKDERCGKFKYKLDYELEFDVIDSAKFARFFVEKGISPKDKSYKSLFISYFNLYLKKYVKKHNLPIQFLIMPNSNTSLEICDFITNEMSAMSVVIKNFAINEVLASKRMKARLNQCVEKEEIVLNYKTNENLDLQQNLESNNLEKNNIDLNSYNYHNYNNINNPYQEENISFSDDIVENEGNFNFQNSNSNLNNITINNNDEYDFIKNNQEENVYVMPTLDEIMNGNTRDNIADAKIQAQSQNNISQAKFCYNCGAKLVNNSHFCHICGAKVIFNEENNDRN